jgi:uncharacterized protein (TIGR03000 family)
MFWQKLSLSGIVSVVALLTWNSSQLLAQEFYPRANAPLYPFGTSIDSPTTYGAFTEGPGYFTFGAPRANTADEQVAYLHIRVSPPDAEINFDGVKTMQVGSSRLFITPAMEVGKPYTYTLRATWNLNGKTVSQERVLPIHAGDRLSIAFRAPTLSTKTSELQARPSPRP